MRFREAAHGVIALPGAFLFGGVNNLFDEIREQPGIALLPEQNTVGGIAVASGAARFLVVLLDRLWQREVNHGAHGGFVNA